MITATILALYFPAIIFILGGLRGSPHVGKTQARNPTDKPKVGQGPAREGDLGAAAGSALMLNTCVRGPPGVCDARAIGGVVRHVAVIRIALVRL